MTFFGSILLGGGGGGGGAGCFLGDLPRTCLILMCSSSSSSEDKFLGDEAELVEVDEDTPDEVTEVVLIPDRTLNWNRKNETFFNNF